MRWLILVIVALIGTPSAHAAPFTATELSYDAALLSQFNLISLGDFNTASNTEGRVLVGGDATTIGTRTVCFNGGCNGNAGLGATSTPATGPIASSASNLGYGAVTVFGNLFGAFNILNGGDLDVRGNASAGISFLNGRGSFNLGGTSQLATIMDRPTAIRTAQPGRLILATNVLPWFSTKSGVPIESVFPFGSSADPSFTTPLTNLAQGLAALPGALNVNAQVLPASQSGTSFLAASDYKVNGKQYGVVTTTLANLVAQGPNFAGIKNGAGNDATFVIVTGDVKNAVLPTLNYTDSKVLYDFVDAKSLIVSSTFNGSILAPLAELTQSGVINGSVVVASLSQSQELHQGNLFTGDLSGLVSTLTPLVQTPVPEPASLAVFGLAAVLLVVSRSFLRTPRPLPSDAAPPGGSCPRSSWAAPRTPTA